MIFLILYIWVQRWCEKPFHWRCLWAFETFLSFHHHSLVTDLKRKSWNMLVWVTPGEGTSRMWGYMYACVYTYMYVYVQMHICVCICTHRVYILGPFLQAFVFKGSPQWAWCCFISMGLLMGKDFACLDTFPVRICGHCKQISEMNETLDKSSCAIVSSQVFIPWFGFRLTYF